MDRERPASCSWWPRTPPTLRPRRPGRPRSARPSYSAPAGCAARSPATRRRAHALRLASIVAATTPAYGLLGLEPAPTALLTLSAVDDQGDAVALERVAWSALGILLGVAVGELFWRLAPHLPRVAPAGHGASRKP